MAQKVYMHFVWVLLWSVCSGGVLAEGFGRLPGGRPGPRIPATVAPSDVPSVGLQSGRLVYTYDSLGNRIPDYSCCGYKFSGTPIPEVPVQVVVHPVDGDATALVQHAIDKVAALPVQKNGFRGAVLLREGIYNLSGRLQLKATGVVLRGSGENTIVRATGHDRETLIRIHGKNDRVMDAPRLIVTGYVPVNATRLEVDDASGLEAGRQVSVHHPSTLEWIGALKMDEFGGETAWLGWKPGQRDIFWEREIVGVRGNTITLDVPLTAALDTTYSRGRVVPFSWPGRISQVGIERMTLESESDPRNPKDEDHCWFAITMENVRDGWVREVTFRHFAGSAVALYETASRITVRDCISLDPVSEIAGQRRNTFFTMGQQTLFLRCYAENGIHDFSTGFCAAGPNAFVECESAMANGFSGAADSWATGLLFDMVRADGQVLSFKNRGQDGQGAGWTAAHSMFWQCSAGKVECFSPPLALNYAYGTWAQFAGDGVWVEPNSHIAPRSLFFAQLAERLDREISEFGDEYLPFSGESTSSPTPEEAQEFSDRSLHPPLLLKDYIRSKWKKNQDAGAIDQGGIPEEAFPESSVAARGAEPVEAIRIKNGWMVQEGKVITGTRTGVPWWRGDPRPYAAALAMPAITRFVPGRTGWGYTDDLAEVVKFMEERGICVVDHNYGLWYDRRRDDHERVKRTDSESWAPFYEQPFARSGTGEAWDRLSQYDLTRYNPWYWKRLADFARLAGEKGKLLIHQNYFQHNILEAGAHWTDFPWRSANNINGTGFPEPPPYAGDKRIYMANQFYDITHPVRRDLHRAYIRQCLANFAGSANVIQSLSAEYTGPLHFVEFWLDVIAGWEAETGFHPVVALGATKDVQDALLRDPLRAPMVDVIDIRYWAWRDDGTLYAPPGDQQMAPRQHARKIAPGKRSFESVYRSVFEIRSRFPDKAVIYSETLGEDEGWAVLMAGGSLAPLPGGLPVELLSAVTEMKPVPPLKEMKNSFRLANEKGMLVYCREGGTILLNLKKYGGRLKCRFLDPCTGAFLPETMDLMGGKTVSLKRPGNGDVVLWIEKLKQ